MAEDGQRYVSKGPSNLVAFRAEAKHAQGHVQDWGTEIISNNGNEDRFGPSINIKENFITIARRKSDERNTVMVLDCDHLLLTIEFEEGKYRNWQEAWYSKQSVNQLSHFFSGFLRHWGCTR